MNNIQKTNEVLDINAQIQIQKQQLKDIENSEFLIKHKKKMAILECELIVLEKVREELNDTVAKVYKEFLEHLSPTSPEEDELKKKLESRYKSEMNKLKSVVKKIDTKRLEQSISSKTLEMFK